MTIADAADLSAWYTRRWHEAKCFIYKPSGMGYEKFFPTLQCRLELITSFP